MKSNWAIRTSDSLFLYSRHKNDWRNVIYMLHFANRCVMLFLVKIQNKKEEYNYVEEFLFVAGEYFWWLCAYLAIVMVPALIYTVASIKNGWLIWGTKKRETEGKKNFKLRVVIGSLFYGIFVCSHMLIKDGKFDPMGILWVLGTAALFGIPFYFAMMLMIKTAEKRADKNLEEKEKAIEE